MISNVSPHRLGLIVILSPPPSYILPITLKKYNRRRGKCTKDYCSELMCCNHKNNTCSRC